MKAVDADFSAKMLRIRGGKMKASEARKITDGKVKMSDEEIFTDIRRVAACGLYSTVFDQKQLSEQARIMLRQEGYKLIEEDYTVTVAWN